MSRTALVATPRADTSDRFKPIQIHAGPRWTFIIAAIVGLLGILTTVFFVRDLTVRPLLVSLSDGR